MSFAKGDIVALKGNPFNIFVVSEVLGGDLVKVRSLDRYNGQVLPMKALRRPTNHRKAKESSLCWKGIVEG